MISNGYMTNECATRDLEQKFEATVNQEFCINVEENIAPGSDDVHED